MFLGQARLQLVLPDMAVGSTELSLHRGLQWYFGDGIDDFIATTKRLARSKMLHHSIKRQLRAFCCLSSTLGQLTGIQTPDMCWMINKSFDCGDFRKDMQTCDRNCQVGSYRRGLHNGHRSN